MIAVLIFFHLALLLLGGYFLSPEFVLYPYLTDQGFIPYEQILDQHFPVFFFGPISFPYQLVGNRALFHALFIILNGCIDLFFYLSLVKIKSKKPLFFTACLIVVSYYFGGYFFWFNILITFFLSLFLLVSQYDKWGYKFLSGLCLSLVLLSKPTLLPALILMTFYFSSLNLIFVLGVSTPLIISFIYLINLNIVDDFYNLVFVFNSQYYVQFAKQLPNKRQLLFMLGAFSLPLFLLTKKNLTALLISLSFLFLLFPRFEPLHLQPFILILFYFTSQLNIASNQYQLLIIILVIFTSLSLIKLKEYQYKDYYLTPETISISQKVNNLPQKEIFILGGNEMIYPLSGKIPPGIYIPSLPWYFAVPSYQELLIQNLNQSKSPILYNPQAEVDGEHIEGYANFIFDLIQKDYILNQEIEGYQLYYPRP